MSNPTNSKFSSIFEARKRTSEPPSEETPLPSPALVESPPAAPSTPKPRARTQSPDVPKRRGRPSGKRSDGEHVQVTAYIQRKTHRAVKLALLKDEGSPDFSELVEELLSKWLKKLSENPPC